MPSTLPTLLANAAETRRREMPASVALVILTGGFATAIMEGPDAVGWTVIMSLALIFDVEIYRRFDAAETRLEGKSLAALAAWSFACSVFFTELPLALWAHGSAAGAVAAAMLWVAGVVRYFSPGVSGACLLYTSPSPRDRG